MRRHTDDSYLLRLWRDHAGAPLRATVIAVGHPDARRHFAHLDDLVSYLIAQANPAPQRGREEVSRRPDGAHDHCTPDDG